MPRTAIAAARGFALGTQYPEPLGALGFNSACWKAGEAGKRMAA
ncbi:hypothetical protein [Burkholderia sp. Bp8963]|nr:hypothetical protein [Burkholderia sp. Bp8963]